MKNCAELLFSISCYCFALLLLAAIHFFSLEGAIVLAAMILSFIVVTIGLIIGLHGFFSSRKS